MFGIGILKVRFVCMGVKFLDFSVLLHTNSEQNEIGNWFHEPIIFKNPSKTGFSIRNIISQFASKVGQSFSGYACRSQQVERYKEPLVDWQWPGQASLEPETVEHSKKDKREQKKDR